MFSKSTIKYIQSLRQKKYRDIYNVFVAEGPKVVGDLLVQENVLCRNIYATAEWVRENKLAEKFIGIFTVIEDFELEKISQLSQPNQVLAIFDKLTEKKADDVKGKVTLVLDDIQDPGNFGTIIRTADWFGVENIVCSRGCVEMYNPKVVQSTMSSIARVNICYTDIEEWLGNHNAKKYAAVINGKKLSDVDADEAIIVMGNESKGISKEIQAMVDEKITIKGKGGAESLNVAVATGIILNHFSKK